MARRSAALVTGEKPRRGEIRHLSYSTLDSWFSCPKQVQLKKIQLAPATPAWWFAGGSAVHAATEAYDRWTLLDPANRPKFKIREEFELAFAEEVVEMDAVQPDRTQWRHAGPKTAPETWDRWMQLGPLLVGNYIRWRRVTDYVVWVSGDAVGIEIDLSFTPPGCEREIKAYADRVFFTPSLDQIHIVDLKTGTRGPRTPLQFGTYGAGLEHLHGVKASTGMAFMNREGDIGKPFSLAKYTPEYVGRLFGYLSRAVDAEVFPAHLGSSCRMCDVQDSCYANDGPLAELYDPDHPNYAPPF